MHLMQGGPKMLLILLICKQSMNIFLIGARPLKILTASHLQYTFQFFVFLCSHKYFWFSIVPMVLFQCFPCTLCGSVHYVCPTTCVLVPSLLAQVCTVSGAVHYVSVLSYYLCFSALPAGTSLHTTLSCSSWMPLWTCSSPCAFSSTLSSWLETTTTWTKRLNPFSRQETL